MVSAKFQEVYDAMEKFKVPNNTTGNPTNDQKLDVRSYPLFFHLIMSRNIGTSHEDFD